MLFTCLEYQKDFSGRGEIGSDGKSGDRVRQQNDRQHNQPQSFTYTLVAVLRKNNYRKEHFNNNFIGLLEKNL